MAVHHRRIELIGMDLALGGDQHVADHAQAVYIGVERAQAIAQLLGQHGDHAAREIDAGRAVIGIDVDGAARGHVVAHVGNRHQQAPALAAPDLGGLAVDGIVEIARVLAIDGHQGHIGQIDALLAVGRPHPVRQRLGLRQAGIGKHMRDAVLAHRDLDLHAGIIDFTEHFDDATHWLAEQRGRLGQFHHDHLADLGRACGIGGDQDVLTVALVFGGHQPYAAFLQEAANDVVRRALDDLDNAAFGPAAAVLAHDADPHTVLVQHGTHFIGGKEDVAFAVIADDEAMSVAVPLHTALDFVVRVGAFGVRVHFLGIQSKSFLRCPGGGIGRRTSFRY